MYLSHVGLGLVFELFIWTKIGDEHLVCLFEWSIETILASNHTLVCFNVNTMTVLVGGLHVKNLYPHVFSIMIPWERVNALLGRAYLSLDWFQYILSKIQLILALRRAWHWHSKSFLWTLFAMLGCWRWIYWAKQSWVDILSHFFGVIRLSLIMPCWCYRWNLRWHRCLAHTS